jgi:hypothetical protein
VGQFPADYLFLVGNDGIVSDTGFGAGQNLANGVTTFVIALANGALIADG